jgi:hypothetical protein
VVEIKWKSGKLERKYECAFCSQHLKQPIRFQDCLHRVCSHCFTEILRSNSLTCPTCNFPITREKVRIVLLRNNHPHKSINIIGIKVMVDSDFGREIQNLPVYCMYSLSGCEWNGYLKEYSVGIFIFGFKIFSCIF